MPITDLSILTQDGELNSIDSCTGAAIQTDQVGEFQLKQGAQSVIEIENGNDMVEATGVKLKVTLFPANDIPKESKIFMTFSAADWKLNCAVAYSVTCL